MEALLHSVNAVGLIVIMIAVGFICGKTKMMNDGSKKFVIKYLINIAVPAACISNIFEQFAKINIENPIMLFVPPVLAMLVTLAISLVAAKLFKMPKKRFGVFVVMCAFSNSLFVGLPMCKELFGDIGVPYVIIYYIVNTMMFWTVGAALIQNASNTETKLGKRALEVLKKLATPPLISIVAAVILLCVGFKPPHIVMSLCGYFGGTVSPLALMYVGYIISQVKLKELSIGRGFVFAMIMRFIVAPAVTLGFCKLFGIEHLTTSVFIMESAMPVMTQSVIVASAYGADEKYAATAMTVSTLLCLIFIPAWYVVMSLV